MTQKATLASGATLTFDPATQTMDLASPPNQSSTYFFETPADVREFFSELVLAWSRLTSNRRVCWLIRDKGFTVAPDAKEAWVFQIDFIAQVTASELFVIGADTPTNAVMPHAQRYPTREQALVARDVRRSSKTAKTSPFHVDMTKRCDNGVTLQFDTKHLIVEITIPERPQHKRFFLETEREVRDHMIGVEAAWLSGARGQKVYFLINYKNFDVNPTHSDLYVRLVNAFFAQSALAVVRYNANLLQSATIRHTLAKGLSPANLYQERNDALAVVKVLTDGRVTFAEDGATALRRAKCRCGVSLTYDRTTKVIEVVAPPTDPKRKFLIETLSEVRNYLQEITLAWAEMTGSQPVYWLVNYQNFSINPEVRPDFDRDIADLMRAASIRLVRYNVTLAQSIALRRAIIKDKKAPDVYSSRQDALAALSDPGRGVHSGEL